MLGPIATLIVGFAAALIAWQQWLLARNKLRLDLFDRRFKIYQTTKDFLKIAAWKHDLDDKHRLEFLSATADAEFLFGADIVEYLAEVKRRYIELLQNKNECEPLPIGQERSRYAKEILAGHSWFIEQTTGCVKVFKPYLDFSQVKVDSGLFPGDDWRVGA